MKLPTEMSKRKTKLSDQTVLAFGHPKVGKSTFCANIPNVLFLATEAGLKHLDAYELPIGSWEEFAKAVKLIKDGEHKFEAVAIDTVGLLYKYCSEYVCKKHNVKYPGDLPHGKGWAFVNGEFQRLLTILAQLPYGVFLVAHAKSVTVKQSGKETTRIVPDLSDGARKILTGFVDHVLYMESDISASEGEPQRRIRTKPSANYEAGSRLSGLPDPIVMSNNPKEGFKTFMDSYNKAMKEDQQ